MNQLIFVVTSQIFNGIKFLTLDDQQTFGFLSMVVYIYTYIYKLTEIHDSQMYFLATTNYI